MKNSEFVIKDSFVELSNDVYKDLKRYMANSAAIEISNLDKPCYQSKYLKYKSDIEYMLKLDREKRKLFLKQFRSKYRNFKLINDDFTLDLIMLLIYTFKVKDYEFSRIVSLFLSIKFYTSLIKIMFPLTCNESKWNLALSKLSSKHLFKTEKSISLSISYLNKVVLDKYKSDFIKSEIDDEVLVKYVFELRSRIAQSLKSFANLYYSVIPGETFVVDDFDKDEQVKTSESNLSIMITDRICVYSEIDERAVLLSAKYSGVLQNVASEIVEEISSVEYKESLGFLLVLLFRAVTDVKKTFCYERNRTSLIRKILSGSVYVGKYNLKKNITDFLSNLQTVRFSKESKIKSVNFLLHYLTLYIQKKIC